MVQHKILWSSPEGRFLIVDADTMTLHVLKLEAGAPPPSLPLPPDKAKELRPLDWGSAARIVGPANVEKFIEALVDQCWDKISQVALIFINAPDQWPARTSFHAQASARGSALSPRGTLGTDTPLDAFGLGGIITGKLSTEIRAHGKFADLDDLAKRVREGDKPSVRRNIIKVITTELTTAAPQAMFFARRDGKFVFRSTAPPVKPPAADDDEEEDHRPPPPSRYRM